MESATSSPTPDEKGFPHFEDGDVLIVSGDGRSWKLHSTTLRNASGRFKTLLDENDARHMTKKQKIEGKTIRFKLEMSASEDSPDIRFRSFRAFVRCSYIFFFIFYDEYVLLFLHYFSKWYY
jgi:hypothetical protein